MKACDLLDWLLSWHPVGADTVDCIIVGSDATDVRGVAVMWYPTWRHLREAVALGCNVVVTHEPTFFTHYDLRGFDEAFRSLPEPAQAAVAATRDEKRRWIEQQDLVVIRCHDVLDSMPGGIVDTLAARLGFSLADYATQSPHYRVVALEPAQRAGALARRLAERFAAIGQPGVAFYGDPEREVRRLGLGTRYGCDPWHFVTLGADVAVTINDRVKTWTELAWADDAGFPLIVIDHGTSEEWGVERLSELIREKYPQLPVHFLRQGCSFRWITPASRQESVSP